jgi:ABC-type proline/glycine betaine transport system permease subunit
VALMTAAYGALVAVANARNDVITNDFTTRWVLVGSRTDFPGDFGRNVLAGSVALGVVILAIAVAVWFTAGDRAGRAVGVVASLFAVLLVATYRDSGNVLAARPSAAAVLLAVGVYLLAARPSLERAR